jgi:hypothetical protein
MPAYAQGDGTRGWFAIHPPGSSRTGQSLMMSFAVDQLHGLRALCSEAKGVVPLMNPHCWPAGLLNGDNTAVVSHRTGVLPAGVTKRVGGCRQTPCRNNMSHRAGICTFHR